MKTATRASRPTRPGAAMHAKPAFDLPVAAFQRGRRALALLVALAAASLAFGVGLPWILADAPPVADELWARQVQSAPAFTPLRADPRGSLR